MARKKSSAKKFEFKGFHNLEFDPEQKAAILQWMDAFPESPTDAMVVLVEGGYKVSIGYDAYHGTYQMSLTCKDTSSEYCGYCFTLKHDDIGRGMIILRYVYDCQLQKGMLAVNEPKNTFDW